MQIELLDNLADKYPECQIAAYVDISVGITLRTASTNTAPQEVLDELCAEANLTFALGGSASNVAIRTSPSEFIVFLRTAEDEGDALVFQCLNSVDFDEFLTDAKTILESAL